MKVTSLEIDESTDSGRDPSRSGASARRSGRLRAVVRGWFDGSHLGPVNNYVTR